MSEILSIVRKHNEFRNSCLNMQVSENFLSMEAKEALSSDMASRYSLEIDGKEAYGGAKYSEEVLHTTEKLVSSLYGSKFAEVRPIGGHIASEIVLLSLVSRKDNVLSIPEANGGYTGYEGGYLPQMLGFKNYHIPYDDATQEIRFENLEKLMQVTSPNLLVLGQSFFVRHYDLKRIMEICEPHGTKIAYDGSHVMGLIAGKAFQKDVLEYCDVLFGSTHKSFFGPQGGIILTNDEDIYNTMSRNITWRSMDNYHPSRVAALGVAAEEMTRSGEKYASLVVSNSHSLGKELNDLGIGVRFSPWFSETHQIIVDSHSLNKSGLDYRSFSERLEENGIIVDREGRVGTAEISRYGFNNMHEIAELMQRAVKGERVKDQVRELLSQISLKY